MKRQDFGIIAFENTHAAISAQQALQQAEMQVHIMPTPREITAGCGLSLRFPPEEYLRVKGLVEGLSFPGEYCHFYRMTYDEQHRQVVPMEEGASAP